MPAQTLPASRHRLQSRILVSIGAPILLLLSLLRLAKSVTFPFPGHPTDPLKAFAITAAFALLVRGLRAATSGAALCGALVCFLLTLAGTSPLHSLLPPLTLLFILTFFATRLGRARKQSRGLAEPRTGRRASQVLANLAIAALAAAFARVHPTLTGCSLAALAEATADTVSSEIGQAFGGTPRLLTTLRTVPPGTDGAVTFTGTFAGIAAATLVAASAIPALGLTLPQATLALAAATAGLFFDSLLGATLERRGWIGNDLVNLLSTAFAAALACSIPFLTGPRSLLLH